MTQESTLTHWDVTIDGSPLQGLMESVRSIEVDQTLSMPSMCTITLNDGTAWTDNTRIGLGHTVKVNAHSGPGTTAPAAEIFFGDIVAIEGDFDPGGHSSMSIRSYDRLHRLQRGSHIRSWTRISDSDIASRIGSEYGLTVEAESTRAVHEHLVQDNVSDFAFLKERARATDRVLTVSGSRLLFKSLKNLSTSVVELDLGLNLLELRARVSASGQVLRVESRGWDPRTKKKIESQTDRLESAAALTEYASSGAGLFRSSAGVAPASLVMTHASPVDQSAADVSAMARLAHLSAGDFRADGVALGDPRIHAGGRVKVVNQGRFNGEYVVTSARHVYDGGHYLVHFSIAGANPVTMADLISGPDAIASHPLSGRTSPGPAVGIVTQNKDPENLGRVKVKFPWLDEQIESAWARLASPMAGPGRGLMIIPEVNDEVLVAFEHGDLNRPFVLGALWNGDDRPPIAANEAVSGGGEVNKRILKTRAGHTILLNDEAGKESIEVIDKTGKNSIVIESSTNKITVTSTGDITLKATQNVSIEGMAVSIKGQQSVKVEGAQVEVAGQGSTSVSAQGTTTIRGGTVQIN